MWRVATLNKNTFAVLYAIWTVHLSPYVLFNIIYIMRIFRIIYITKIHAQFQATLFN